MTRFVPLFHAVKRRRERGSRKQEATESQAPRDKQGHPDEDVPSATLCRCCCSRRATQASAPAHEPLPGARSPVLSPALLQARRGEREETENQNPFRLSFLSREVLLASAKAGARARVPLSHSRAKREREAASLLQRLPLACLPHHTFARLFPSFSSLLSLSSCSGSWSLLSSFLLSCGFALCIHSLAVSRIS